jgi:hypothetical protein
MSPNQVAAASGGSVKVLDVGKRTRDDADRWALAARGSFVDGALSLDVGFTFDTRTNGLICVVYNTLGEDVAALKAVLTKRYGKPASTSSYGPTQNANLTAARQDRIHLGSGASSCCDAMHIGRGLIGTIGWAAGDGPWSCHRPCRNEVAPGPHRSAIHPPPHSEPFPHRHAPCMLLNETTPETTA